MVNDSTKAQQVRKCEKHRVMMPILSTLMNKQREYNARKWEPSDFGVRKSGYMQCHSAPVPRSMCWLDHRLRAGQITTSHLICLHHQWGHYCLDTSTPEPCQTPSPSCCCLKLGSKGPTLSACHHARFAHNPDLSPVHFHLAGLGVGSTGMIPIWFLSVVYAEPPLTVICIALHH